MPYQELYSLWGKLRRRSRNELERELRTRFEISRTWLQEHGELAAIGGVVLGLLLSLCFKIAFTSFVIVVLMGYSLWFFADSEDHSNHQAETKSESDLGKDSEDCVAQG